MDEWDMDKWKYYGVTHIDHLVCNPTSDLKLDELVELLDLKPLQRVLDVACGKGELLCRIAERWGASCLGVDISPYEVAAAHEKIKTRGLGESVDVLEGDGADYEAPDHSLSLAMCIGATWVWGGYRGTIDALMKLVAPGGLVAIGEPFKLKEPSPEHAATDPDFVASVVTHAENVEIAVAAGLTPLYALVSNQDDWDRYEGLQWNAAEAWARENPDDPDVEELLGRSRKGRDEYLKFGRDTVGWAIYIMRTPT